MLKILIAEDDRELRQLFEHVLVKNGYSVRGVSDGQEALDAMDEEYFNLIISDIMMPVMDGYTLVRSLREAGDTTPVLMITAKDAFDDMRMGFLSGTDDYMVKPVNVNEMVLRVSALLRRAQMISERRQVIGWGVVISIVSFLLTWVVLRKWTDKEYIEPVPEVVAEIEETSSADVNDILIQGEDLPGTLASFLTILIPVVLIAGCGNLEGAVHS